MSDQYLTPDQFAATLKDGQLACRELGHTWVPWTVEVIHTSGGRRARIGGYLRVMRCRRCKAERHQLLDSTAGVVANRYVYPDGYLAHKIEGLNRTTFRMEAVVRFVTNNEDRVTHSADGEKLARATRAVVEAAS